MTTPNIADLAARLQFDTPLRFYGVVAVGVLIVVSVVAPFLPETERKCCYFAGIGVATLAILIVSVFAWCKPQNLTYDKESHAKKNGNSDP